MTMIDLHICEKLINEEWNNKQESYNVEIPIK